MLEKNRTATEQINTCTFRHRLGRNYAIDDSVFEQY